MRVPSGHRTRAGGEVMANPAGMETSERYMAFFDPLIGRPSTPVECYLWLMFLKFRYRLG